MGTVGMGTGIVKDTVDGGGIGALGTWSGTLCDPEDGDVGTGVVQDPADGGDVEHLRHGDMETVEMGTVGLFQDPGLGRDMGTVGMGMGTVQDGVGEKGSEDGLGDSGMGTTGMFQNPGDGGDMGPMMMGLGHSRILRTEEMLGTGDKVRATPGPWGLKGDGDSRDTDRDTLGPQGWGHGNSGNGLRDCLETWG